MDPNGDQGLAKSCKAAPLKSVYLVLECFPNAGETADWPVWPARL